MKTDESTFTDLLTRYFSGEADSEEIKILSGWVQSDPDRRKEFEDFRRTWTLLQEAQIGEAVDADQEWGSLKASLPDDRTIGLEPKSRFSYKPLLRIAAVAVLLLIPAWFLWRHFTRPEQITLTASVGPVECRLSDGTLITLNKGAMLRYPEEFAGKTRTVSINGEACFEVAHDPSRPFIVEAGNVRVEALGTVFYVRTGADRDSVSVLLSSGSVATYFQGGRKNEVILLPGEVAEISVSSQAITKHPADDPNQLAWKTRLLVFDNTPLGEIVTLLNEVYQTRLTLAGPQMAGCRVTATFDHQSLESVLTVLRATLDVTIEHTNRGMVISGKPCE